MPDMPVVSEQDLEQLEAYVDGEMSTGEEDALRARMQASRSWPRRCAACARIAISAWRYGKGTSQRSTVARLIAKVDESVDRNTNWSYTLRNFKRLPRRRRASCSACDWTRRNTGDAMTAEQPRSRKVAERRRARGDDGFESGRVPDRQRGKARPSACNAPDAARGAGFFSRSSLASTACRNQNPHRRRQNPRAERAVLVLVV
jgi:hypothetical protein